MSERQNGQTYEQLATHYLENAAKNFRRLKESADRAAAQVDDEGFFRLIDDESNSIALVFKHLSGNLRSRWTDFLTTDGDKPDRRRDSEFVVEEGDTRSALAERWEAGWQTLFDTLASLRPEDLLATVRIRGQGHTVVEAVNRQLAHYGEHVGQIVLLAKHVAGRRWQTLSIARGQSEAFNAEMDKKHGRS
ncbi:MAG TPA: DUF1572 family protein [Pyrinomonadaceae bacterium]|nr:DUF1572 family protein [Pyrinomonadaceae bacterium]